MMLAPTTLAMPKTSFGELVLSDRLIALAEDADRADFDPPRLS